MKITELLLEYDRKKTATNLADRLVDAMQLDPAFKSTFEKKSAAKIQKLKDLLKSDQLYQERFLSKFEDLDPTKNKEYTPWIVRTYVKQRHPDIDALKTLLPPVIEKYADGKKRNLVPQQYKDINRIGTFDELSRVVRKLPKPKTKNVQVVYDGDDCKIVTPLDEKAACQYGANTRWCTSAKENNRFDSYNLHGPLYIIIPKDPDYPGEKYQLHFSSNEARNDEDEGVSTDDLIYRFPYITQLPGYRKIINYEEFYIDSAQDIIDNGFDFTDETLFTEDYFELYNALVDICGLEDLIGLFNHIDSFPESEIFVNDLGPKLGETVRTRVNDVNHYLYGKRIAEKNKILSELLISIADCDAVWDLTDDDDLIYFMLGEQDIVEPKNILRAVAKTGDWHLFETVATHDEEGIINRLGTQIENTPLVYLDFAEYPELAQLFLSGMDFSGILKLSNEIYAVNAPNSEHIYYLNGDPVDLDDPVAEYVPELITAHVLDQRLLHHGRTSDDDPERDSEFVDPATIDYDVDYNDEPERWLDPEYQHPEEPSDDSWEDNIIDRIDRQRAQEPERKEPNKNPAYNKDLSRIKQLAGVQPQQNSNTIKATK